MRAAFEAVSKSHLATDKLPRLVAFPVPGRVCRRPPCPRLSALPVLEGSLSLERLRPVRVRTIDLHELPWPVLRGVLCSARELTIVLSQPAPDIGRAPDIVEARKGTTRLPLPDLLALQDVHPPEIQAVAFQDSYAARILGSISEASLKRVNTGKRIFPSGVKGGWCSHSTTRPM